MIGLLLPEKKILELIAADSNPEFSQTDFLMPQTYPFIDNQIKETIDFVKQTYREKYGIDVSQNRKLFTDIEYSACECLANSRKHGSKNGLALSHIVVVGQKGVCQGFFDGNGSFFRNPEVARRLMEKAQLRKIDLESPCGRGFRGYIYPNSDMIRVDTNRGVLYCVHLL